MFESMGNYGVFSLAPLVTTIVLAFIWKDAILALFLGCTVGILMIGLDPARGFSQLAQQALGNEDFIWIALIILFIGILFGLFKRAGVIHEFVNKASAKVSSRKSAKILAWVLGLFIVDDYFSPLMTGTVMRPITDTHRISREKLAYILDATTSSVCTLIPFMAWGAFLGGLVLEQGGPVSSIDQGIAVFARSIPYNFYSIITVLLTLLVAMEIFPDFGPMRKAEKRSLETGKVLRDGANPMTGSELDDLFPQDSSSKVYLFAHLVMPMLIIIGIAGYTFVAMGSIKICEAFMAAVFYTSLALFATKTVRSVPDFMKTVMSGMQGVLPALTILALAYCLNTVTKGLGAANYILTAAEGWLTPSLLVMITFLAAAVISFSTGTSWGAFAVVMPFALPVAYSLSGGVVTPVVLKTVAALTGGGIFGDHASPVSDTTVLSSMGAGCDHIDHVKTQLPYALLVALITCGLYYVL